MPWLWILFLIIGAYLVVKIVQGIRDVVAWAIENRELAAIQKESKERHRQGHLSKPPALKERPEHPTKLSRS